MKKLVVLLAVGTVWACRPPPPPPQAVDEPVIHNPVPLNDMQQQGRLIYETMCWTCHGAAGRGDGPAVQAGAMTNPPSFHTQDYLHASVGNLEGRFRSNLAEADPAHPHMKYVASLLQPERFAEALSFIPALGYPSEIPGSAIAGEQLYKVRCIGCHGEFGMGDGTAAPSLVAMPPADFTTDSLIAAKDWDALHDRVRDGGRAVHGSSMPPWGVVMNDAQIWDLVAYLATFQPAVLAPPSWR